MTRSTPNMLKRFALILVVGLLLPAQAHAMDIESYGDVEEKDWSFVATAKPGEVNNVTITTERDGRWRIRDTGAPIDDRSPSPCQVVSANEMLCHADEDYGTISIDLGDGDDTLALPPARKNYGAQILASGGEGDDVIQGGSSPEILSGGAGDDRVLGGAGNDTFGDEPGNDIIDGGAGLDTLDLTHVSARLSVDLGTARPRSIEGLHVSGGGPHVLSGNGSRNIFDLDDLDGSRIDTRGGDDLVRLQGRGTFAIDLKSGDDAIEISTGNAGLEGKLTCGAGNDRVISPPYLVLEPDCERWWTYANHVTVASRITPNSGDGVAVRCDNTTRRDPCRVKLTLRDADGRSLGSARATIPERGTRTLRPKTKRRRAGIVTVQLTVDGRGSRTAKRITSEFRTRVG